MTRLKTEWIAHMLDGMDVYNRQLAEKTGFDLAGLMQEIFGISEEELVAARQEKKIAVVPITQGEGIIGSFSESVASIIESMGFTADVMEHTDVDGIYDASRLGYDILFFADDVRYLALNIKTGKSSDNNYATALGFVQVMRALMKKHGTDLCNEKLLQIGYGIVGKESASLLRSMGVNFDLYDKDSATLAGVEEHIVSQDEIKQYGYILDFTNEGGWLKKADLAEDVLYASPGVPYSMDEEAANCFEDRAIHDNLEIGTAIMLGQVLKG